MLNFKFAKFIYLMSCKSNKWVFFGKYNGHGKLPFIGNLVVGW